MAYIPVPVVFLDRDGVINKPTRPHEYITDWKDFVILPGVYDALRMFNDSGFRVFVVTNQRCIARKMATLEQVNALHRKMTDDFAAHNCFIDGVYICPHDDNDNCSCRKPRTGLFLQAQKYLEESGCTVDKSMSWMIGDALSDIEAGENYGVNTFFADGADRDILCAARKIIEGRKLYCGY